MSDQANNPEQFPGLNKSEIAELFLGQERWRLAVAHACVRRGADHYEAQRFAAEIFERWPFPPAKKRDRNRVLAGEPTDCELEDQDAAGT